MPKSLEELKNDIKNDEIMESIVALIESEKQKGISAKHQANQEAANLRKFKKAMEALGYDDTSDLDQFTSSIIDIKTKQTSSNNEGDKLTLKSLSDQVRTLNKALEDERNRSRDLEHKAKAKTMSAKLTEALHDKVYGADLLIKSLISDGTVKMDNDNIVFVEDGINIPFEQGVSKLLEKRKDILKNTQVSGSNTKGSNDIPADLASIINSGDRNKIRENLSKIKQNLGLK